LIFRSSNSTAPLPSPFLTSCREFKEGILNPLDNVVKKKVIDHGVMHQYYISVVPTTYHTLDGKDFYVHQFTANSNEIKTHMMPAIFFRYSITITAS